ncbi:Protein RTF1-like protein [Zea mays]|uniref:Protein RTF1-like protein n=1 Tax=Zea mays TaxID=4577 RepID=A0A1D6EEQ6_MAIZE|nr:Protein RTF1-like protein [Zea mays]
MTCHPDHCLCKADIKLWLFSKKKWSRSLDVEDSKVKVFWDLADARFSVEPEPVEGFYVVVVFYLELALLLDDMKKDAYRKTRASQLTMNAPFMARREHIYGKKIHSAKAQFCDNGQFNHISIECDTVSVKDLCLKIRVDKKPMMQVKRLAWKDDEFDESSSRLDPLKFDDRKSITLRRSKLVKWFMEPFFDDLIFECFMWLGIGKTEYGTLSYRMCIVSDSPPKEEEFMEWLQKEDRNGACIPTQQEVLGKKEAIQEAYNFEYSAATVQQMLRDKSVVRHPINIVAEKDRLRSELSMALSRRNEAKAERMRVKQKNLQRRPQPESKDNKVANLESMNWKNRADNFKNALELKLVNISLKAGESGYDPFLRRWTRSRNYYASKP